MQVRRQYHIFHWLFLLTFFVIGTMSCSAQQIELARDGSSAYKIYLPSKPVKTDIKAAVVLQDYFFRVTGVRLLIDHENNTTPRSPGFFIGAGAEIPLNEKRDLEIRLNYRTNSFFYKSPVLGTGIVEESRKMKFNILEFSLGVSVF